MRARSPDKPRAWFDAALFRDRRGLFRLLLAASVVLHAAFGPWNLVPDTDLELRDQEGELSIPIDLAEGFEAPPPAPDVPPPAPPTDSPEVQGGGAGARGPDGGVPMGDGGERDGAPSDGAAPPRKPQERDGGRRDAAADEARASSDGGVREAPAGALAVVGADGGGAAQALLGEASQLEAGPQNVVFAVNVREARKHPVLAALGPMVRELPQWRDFLAGADVDPITAAHWLTLHGPSLIRTERDAVLVGYAVDDAVVDGLVDGIAARSAEGGKVDVGVPGVRAVRGFGDRAPRVFLRPRTGLLAVVPPDYAPTAARILSRARVEPSFRPKEVFFLRLLRPHGAVPVIPECIRELMFSLRRTGDDGLELLGDGDCELRDSAERAARELNDQLVRQNSLAVRLITRGLFNAVMVRVDGTWLRVRVPMARDQLESILALVAGRLGIGPPPLAGSASTRGMPAEPPYTSSPSGSAGH